METQYRLRPTARGRRWLNSWATGVFCLMLLAGNARSAIVTETFEDDADWFGTGSLNFSHNAGGQYLEGSFNPIGFPLIGGFRADETSSDGAFVGNLAAIPELATVRFDFLAADTLPTFLAFRFFGNATEFFYSLSLSAAGVWHSLAVPMTYTSDWDGGNEAQFNAALSNVQWMEVTMQTTPFGAQTYGLDNFELSDQIIVIIPEPDYMLLFVCFLIFVLRRHKLGKPQAT